MSERVCYLAREGMGLRLAGVRLVDDRGDEAWVDAAGEDPADAPARAAAWVAERVARAKPRSAGLVCLDADGSACAWLSAPDGEEASLALAAARLGAEESGGSGGALSPIQAPLGVMSGRLVQALAPARSRRDAVRSRLLRRARKDGAAAAAQRLAVLNVPDSSVRLFLDRLDQAGVAVDGVVSVWHAMARAWDPAGPGGPAPRDGGHAVVAESAPACAALLVDRRGRLLWSWSQGGNLIAAGAARMLGERRRAAPAAAPSRAEGTATRADADEVLATLRSAAGQVSRLASDWLAWSVQTGRAPARIICLCPRSADSAPEERAAAAELGEALGRAWPGASVDLALHEDPIGATLQRLVERSASPAPADDPRASLPALTNRPGRAHRGMYRWTAAALAVGALGLGAAAWRARHQAGALREAARDAAAQTRQRIMGVYPQAVASSMPDKALESEITRRVQARAIPENIALPKPVLAELDILSLVLESPDIEWRNIVLAGESAQLDVTTPSIRDSDELLRSLMEVEGSRIDWKRTRLTAGQEGGRVTSVFTGVWTRQPAVAPAPAAPGTASAAGRRGEP